MYFINPIKKHPLFEKYVIFIDEQKGLYSIIAISKEDSSKKIMDNTFIEVHNSVIKNYGPSETVDVNVSLRDKKYKNVGRYIYCEQWNKELKDDLSCIFLYETEYAYSYGLVLQYDFTNKSAVEDAQDDVL